MRKRRDYDYEPEEDEDFSEAEPLSDLPDDFDLFKICQYTPSAQAASLHASPARFRFQIWGIKSGKTYSGAYEFLRALFDKYRKRSPGQRILGWVVAPSLGQLDTCEYELETIFEKCREAGFPILEQDKKQKRQYHLFGGRLQIHRKTAEIPDNLRGPNVDVCWCDEAAFYRKEAWDQIKLRTGARVGLIIITTTPKGRSWLFSECVLGGLPVVNSKSEDSDYGEFHSQDGMRWVSHYPTSAFPWFNKADLEDAKSTMTREEFEQELEAKFVATGRSVFRYIEESLHKLPLIRPADKFFVMGTDLAKQKDWTAIVIMDGSGVIYHVVRWTGVDWKIQKERIRDLAIEWNAACVIDLANVGSAIAEDLHNMGVNTHPVQLHDPAVKIDVIQALQVAFDSKVIRVPDPSTEWAPKDVVHLINELRAYEAGLTRGNKLTFSAPKGMNDDLVIATALAWWGRRRGLAGGGVGAVEITLAREQWDEEMRRELAEEPDMNRSERRRMSALRLKGPERGMRMFGKASRSSGLRSPRTLWH